jgi:hypothetical protein
MHRFRELDLVRVARLNSASRDIDGNESVARQPLVGDVGAIVTLLGNDRAIVECVEGNGRTLWIAEFSIHELEPVASLISVKRLPI